MSDFIMIKNVRVSFPHLFRRPINNGEEGRCGATLMLDPVGNKAAIELLENQIAELIQTRFKGAEVSSDKICIRDGEQKSRPEYKGYKVLSANCKEKPLVISTDGKGVILNEAESPIYAGCYVNAKIRLWTQSNHYGKRINAELVAIQFAQHGEPLDGTYVSVADAMDGFADLNGGKSKNLAA
ncbi:DUF2815 family protein [Paraneptunicella aestuarii]|uniref:ssDNA-binding protein n=1 Tax=Paraneptunicella aestuarii TaxID=2831148 RepID=UPI001E3E67D7|nr:ssDNA-binding protein [Paraneptunicella aestuarii]UAA38208.1 DUF2815 family protein [Paraneptunicella aestuarii]